MNVTNISNLLPNIYDNYLWLFALKCSNCLQQTTNNISVISKSTSTSHIQPAATKHPSKKHSSSSKQSAASSETSDAFQMKCHFCKFDMSLLLLYSTLLPYNAESNNLFVPLITVEARGCEITSWIPSNNFICEGETSKAKFTNVDLSELEYFNLLTVDGLITMKKLVYQSKSSTSKSLSRKYQILKNKLQLHSFQLLLNSCHCCKLDFQFRIFVGFQHCHHAVTSSTILPYQTFFSEKLPSFLATEWNPIKLAIT